MSDALVATAAATRRRRPARVRQDAESSAFERQMNDKRALDAYDQLKLDAARAGVDPNDSEVEEPFEGYMPPRTDPRAEQHALLVHDHRAAELRRLRADSMAAMRRSPSHMRRPDIERIAAEVEMWNGQRATGSAAGGVSPTAAGAPGGRGRRHANAADEEADAEMSQHVEDDSDMPRIQSTPHYLRGTLRGYQVEGVNWLLSLFHRNLNGILADEMGLGKTFQTIASLSYVRFSVGLPGPFLVVVPKSVLGNWYREFKKWAPAFHVFKFHGPTQERPGLIRAFLTPPLRFDVVITTYDMITREPAAFKRISWQYLIVDEAHKLKNAEGIAFKLMAQISASHRLLITGTPLQNDLKELWALLHFLSPTLFDDGTAFDSWFDAASGQADQRAIQTLHALIGPLMLRRLKADVATGIPPKREIYVSCGMAPKQRQTYLGVLTRDAEALNRGGGPRSALMNIVMQLRKACNHPYLFPGTDPTGGTRTTEQLIGDCGKMVILDKLLAKLHADAAAKHKILIFSQMTRMLDIFEDFLSFRGYGYCRLDGSTDSLSRDMKMAEFNNPDSDKFVFILSTRAGGLGINLQAANHVVIYDSDWNPQMDLQAQDRAHRIGQKRAVSVYRFVTDGTMEERVYTRALKKLYLDAVVVQQGRIAKAKDQASKEELMSMIRFGANDLFKSSTKEVTDADIDALLAAGQNKMDEVTKSVVKEQQASLASFKMGVEETNVYEFEGVVMKSRPGDRPAANGQISKMILAKLLEPAAEAELRTEFSQYGEVVKLTIHPNLVDVLVTYRLAGEAAMAIEKSVHKCSFVVRESQTVVTADMIDEHWGGAGENLGRGRRNRGDFLTNVQGEEDESAAKADAAASKIPMPRLPKKPAFKYYQLFNEERLREIHQLEVEVLMRNWKRRVDAQREAGRRAEMSAEARQMMVDREVEKYQADCAAAQQAGSAPPPHPSTFSDPAAVVDEELPAALLAEKEQLQSGGFQTWSHDDFRHFRDVLTRGLAVPTAYADIALQMAMSRRGGHALPPEMTLESAPTVEMVVPTKQAAASGTSPPPQSTVELADGAVDVDAASDPKVGTPWEFDKTPVEVQRYATAFFIKGPAVIPHFEQIERKIATAAQRRVSDMRANEAVRNKIESCPDPLRDLRFKVATKDAAFDRQLFLRAYDNRLLDEPAEALSALRRGAPIQVSATAGGTTTRTVSAGEMLGPYMKELPQNALDVYIRTRTSDFFEKRLLALLRSVVSENRAGAGGDEAASPDGRRVTRAAKRARQEEDGADGDGGEDGGEDGGVSPASEYPVPTEEAA